MPEIMFTKPMPSLSPRSISGGREGREGRGKNNAFSLLYGHFNSSLFTLVSFCDLMRDKDVVLVIQIPACVRSGTYSRALRQPRGADPVSQQQPHADSFQHSPIMSMQRKSGHASFFLLVRRVRKCHRVLWQLQVIKHAGFLLQIM